MYIVLTYTTYECTVIWTCINIYFMFYFTNVKNDDIIYYFYVIIINNVRSQSNTNRKYISVIFFIYKLEKKAVKFRFRKIYELILIMCYILQTIKHAWHTYICLNSIMYFEKEVNVKHTRESFSSRYLNIRLKYM